MNNRRFPNRWIFIPRKNLQEGYATFRCHCICCSEDWNDILRDAFCGKLECPFCKQDCGIKDFEVQPNNNGPGKDDLFA